MYAPHLSCTGAKRGMIKNIGEEGACLLSADVLEVGSELNLSFFLGNHPHPVVVLSRVVWTGIEGNRYVMGVAFKSEGAGQALAVRRIADYVRDATAASAPEAPSYSGPGSGGSS